jgi:transcriptional regulator with XRE-family HTH domain
MAVMSTPPKHSDPGERLRRIRMRLGLTSRQVAELSQSIATHGNDAEFSISHSRLVQIENEGSVPSIFKLFTLSAIYGVSFTELLTAYIDLNAASRLHISMQHASTHLSSLDAVEHNRPVPMAVCSSSAVTQDQTSLVSRHSDGWEQLPISVLDNVSERKYRYGFIGLSDLTMYPLIRPGSFVQIDECQRPAPISQYRTEFDRPIYFIETRTGYFCSWCEIADGRLISIPHPLSPCRTRQFAFPSEAEIIGRVTGVTVRLTPLTGAERQDASRSTARPVVGSTQGHPEALPRLAERAVR